MESGYYIYSSSSESKQDSEFYLLKSDWRKWEVYILSYLLFSFKSKVLSLPLRAYSQALKEVMNILQGDCGADFTSFAFLFE